MGDDEQGAVFGPPPTNCSPIGSSVSSGPIRKPRERAQPPPLRLQSLDFGAATQQTESLNTRAKYLKDPQVRPFALPLKQQAVFLRTGVFVHKLPPPRIRKPFVQEAEAPERSIMGGFFLKPGNRIRNFTTRF